MSGAERTDGQLLADHLAGDGEAFGLLARRHAAMVLGVCRRVLGSQADAEDAAQAAFGLLAEKAGKLREVRSLGAWLHRWAALCARSALRARSRRARHEKEAAAMRRASHEPPAEAFWREESARLDAAVDSLPERYRRAVVLCYLEGLPQKEAARRLSLPEGTVASLCSRGLEKLRGRLGARRRERFGAAALGALLLERASGGEVSDSFLSSVVSAVNGTGAAGASVLAIKEGAVSMLFWSKVKIFSAAAAAALVLFAAGPLALRAAAGGGDEKPKPKAEEPKPAVTAPVKTEKPVSPAATVKVPARPKVTAAEAAQAAAGINAFGLELYGRLAAAKKGENLCFSPFSISTALGMTYAGARAKTAAVMKKSLHFTLADEKLHPAMGALVDDLNAAGKAGKFKLSVANALWGRIGDKFLPGFLALNKRDYGAGLRRVDFRGNPEGARKTINAWVEKKTENKIKDLIPPKTFNSETNLVLTNAVYFKAEWLRKFKKRSTRERTFKLAEGKEVRTPTMCQRSRFGYSETDDLQVLEMGYQGKRMSMVVLLPKKVAGIAALEKSLTSDKLTLLLASVRNREVIVYLPKFKITSDAKLKDALSSLGMGLAFKRRVADFSGINGIKPPSDGCMYVQEALHKAFVAVDEEGTEAAAATAVIMGAAGNVPPPAPVFKADHPFIFIIRDKVSGAILFLGRVTNPKK